MKNIDINFKGSLVTIYYTDVFFNKKTMKYQYLQNGLEVAVSDELIKDNLLIIPTIKELFWKDVKSIEDLYYKLAPLLLIPFIALLVSLVFKALLIDISNI